MRQVQSRAVDSQTVARPPAPRVAAALNAALAHHNAGRLAEADAIYRQVLQWEPRHADALHLSGLVAHQLGRCEIAIELVRKAAELSPSNAVISYNLGNLLFFSGNFAEAADRFGKAVELEPGYAAAHCNLANSLQSLGRVNAAFEHYQKALALNPELWEAHNNVGYINYKNGDLNASIACYRRALAFKPDYAEALNNLGIALCDIGSFDESVQSFRAAIGYRPDYAEAHSNLGNTLLALGRVDDAIACYTRSLALTPGYALAHFNLGNALKVQKKPGEAVASYRAALAINPGFVEAHINLGSALQDMGNFEVAVACFRRAIELDQGDPKAHFNLGNVLREQNKLAASLKSFRKALELKGDYADAYSNLLYAMQFIPGQSEQEILAEHRGFAARFEAPLAGMRRAHLNSREPDRRMRIGYLSPDFRRHAVANFIEPVLANHDKDEVEVFCYFNSVQNDDTTERLAGFADHWLACKGMAEEQLAERIRADGIDILVDLAGHTAGNRLLVFARKPAPVQVTYLGYPGTSGLSGMDYRISDRYADPEGSEANYSEALLRMPYSLCCYRPAKGMPQVQALPATQNGYITFGSFNNANKIGEPCIDLWSEVLREVPDSRLLMLTVPEGEAREQLVRQFAAHGVDPARLEFHGKLPSGEFHKMLSRADIALDPLPVTGGTTTCESLWMGLPVVVLVGERFISRVGYSFLSAAGVPEFAADSREGYIGIAKGLAGDIARLAEIRGGLRAKLAASSLMDEAGFARGLERIYRDIWAKWCAEGSGAVGVQ